MLYLFLYWERLQCLRMLLHYLTPATCWVSRKTRNGFRLSEQDILYQQGCGTGRDMLTEPYLLPAVPRREKVQKYSYLCWMPDRNTTSLHGA